MPKCACGSEAEYLVSFETHYLYSTEDVEREVSRNVCSECKSALLLKHGKIVVHDLSGMYIRTEVVNM